MPTFCAQVIPDRNISRSTIHPKMLVQTIPGSGRHDTVSHDRFDFVKPSEKNVQLDCTLDASLEAMHPIPNNNNSFIEQCKSDKELCKLYKVKLMNQGWESDVHHSGTDSNRPDNVAHGVTPPKDNVRPDGLGRDSKSFDPPLAFTDEVRDGQRASVAVFNLVKLKLEDFHSEDNKSESRRTPVTTEMLAGVDGVCNVEDSSDGAFKPEDKVVSNKNASFIHDNVKIVPGKSTSRDFGKLHIPIQAYLDVPCSVDDEAALVQSADPDFKEPFPHYVVDIVKQAPEPEDSEKNELAVVRFSAPPIYIQQQPEKSKFLTYLLAIVLVVIISCNGEEIRVLCCNFSVFLIFVFHAKSAPKWCGLHGEQKTAHGRNSNSGGAEHGGTNQASATQVAASPGDLEAGKDGIGDGDKGDRDKEPTRPHPHDQIGDAQPPCLRHGDFKDVSHEIQVVLSSAGSRSQTIMTEMNRCLNCCKLQDEQRCPSGFCRRLTSSIEHFCRRRVSCDNENCSACGLVSRLVKFHLERNMQEEQENEKEKVMVSDTSILGFLLQWFPHLHVTVEATDVEITVVAKPKYLGAGKETKYEEIESAPLQHFAGFDDRQNEDAIGGFLSEAQGATGPVGLELRLVDQESEIEGNLDLNAISKELQDLSITDQRVEQSSLSNTIHKGALGFQSGYGRSSVGGEEPIAMTSDLSSKAKCLHQFYEDDSPTHTKPPPAVQRQLASLPANINQKKVVPVRPGHIGIGGTKELGRACCRWELLRDQGYRRWNKQVHREAEGVFLNNDVVEEHSITVDGRYDEDLHWVRVEKVGEGCFGKAFHCQDITTKAIFCVKELTLEKFDVAEVKVWMKINHSAFCTLRGVVRVGENVLIFMTYVGETLRDYLQEQELPDLKGCLTTRLPLQLAVVLLLQLTEALYHLEQLGILHNDLKSENVLVDEYGDLKIIDFGLSCSIPFGRKYRSQIPAGTPIIRSPERMRSEEYEYTADVWSILCIFREMLTGWYMWFPQLEDAGEFALTFKVGDLKEQPMNLIPSALRLPESILDLFRYGWEIDPSKRHHAADLLPLINQIYSDLESGALEYVEPIPAEVQSESSSEEEDDEYFSVIGGEDPPFPPEAGDAVSCCRKLDFIEDPTQTDPNRVALKIQAGRFPVPLGSDLVFSDVKNPEEEAAAGASVNRDDILGRFQHLLPKFDIQQTSLESCQEESLVRGNVPRFLNSTVDSNASHQVVVNSASQSIDQGDYNVPMLSVLNKNSSDENHDSFSVHVTMFNRPTPGTLKSSDLGSSTQPSMELGLEVQMQSGTTSGIVLDYVSNVTSSYCPTSGLTDLSVSTRRGSIIAFPAVQDDVSDGLMELPAGTPPSPDDQSMSLDQRSKGSSSSDEIYEKFQQELEIDALKLNVSLEDHLPMDESNASSLAQTPVTPDTPTGSGFSGGSSISETRRRISEGSRRPLLLGDIVEGQGSAVATPVVIFHKDLHVGADNKIVTFNCSEEYRTQQIQEVIETVSFKLHEVFEKFTVRDCEGNNLCIDDTIAKIRPQGTNEIHLLVIEADPENNNWYVDNHRVIRSSVY